MRDLYSRLGIERHASDAEVAASLENNPEMSACTAILLNEERRAVYDGTYATLKLIGQLRQRLNLDSGGSWFAENCPDFALRPSFAPASGKARGSGEVETPSQDNQEVRGNGDVKPKSPARSGRLGAVILSIIGVILVIAAITYFLN